MPGHVAHYEGEGRLEDAAVVVRDKLDVDSTATIACQHSTVDASNGGIAFEDGPARSDIRPANVLISTRVAQQPLVVARLMRASLGFVEKKAKTQVPSAVTRT